MNKTSKNIALYCMIFIAGVFLGNMFSGQISNSQHNVGLNSDYPSNNLEPSLLPQTIPRINDIYTEYTQLSKIPKLVNESINQCYKNMKEGHPDIQSIKNPEPYSTLKKGGKSWNQLVNAWEEYVHSVCNTYSGVDVETVFTNSLRENINETEIEAILLFHQTPDGKKMIIGNDLANDAIQKYMAQKSMKEIEKNLPIFVEKQNRIFN